MAKKPNNTFEFESEFSIEKIKTSAELDIKPKFEITDLGIENAKEITIKGTFYDIKLPKEKAISKEIVKAINFIHNGVEHQFIAESESFRYQLDVIRYKNKLTLNQLDGLKLLIWKTQQYINTPKFTGKAEVYNLKQL